MGRVPWSFHGQIFSDIAHQAKAQEFLELK